MQLISTAGPARLYCDTAWPTCGSVQEKNVRPVQTDSARFEGKPNLGHLRDTWDKLTMRKGRILWHESRARIVRNCRIETVGPPSYNIVPNMRESAK